MKQLFFKVVGAAAILVTLGSPAFAQKSSGRDRIADNDEIVIKSKDDKDVKVTVEIKDGEVKVNGKPLAEYDNEDVQVMKRRNLRPGRDIAPVPPTPPSPFRGGTWNFNNNEELNSLLNSNKAFLGVTTETATNGVEVTGVTKGSAAEKSGLKEGDIIARVNDTKIETPADLSKTIAGFKPDEKVEIAYRRDKKDLKTSVTLGKRATSNYAQSFDMNRNFNFDLMSPDGSNFIMRGSGPKLGIKAQDTDDGKGVKVLDVDDESNAAKAGIKEGDILTELDGKSVNSAMELVEAVKNARDKNNLKVKLNRGGKSQEVEIKVPKKLKTANL